MNAKEITVALDIDGTLTPMTQTACAKAGIKFDPKDFNKWYAPKVKEIAHLFKDAEFFRNLPVADGAVEFVKTLRDWGVNIVFVTAVEPEVATARIEWTCEHFGAKHTDVIITSRKDMVKADILLDDASHNVKGAENVRWPILLRSPWSHDITGMTAVNDLKEATAMIHSILVTEGVKLNKGRNGKITCLVGPSGSGKNHIVEALAKEGSIVPRIFTTAEMKQPYYTTISEDEFNALKKAGAFAEATTYAEDNFGITVGDLNNALAKGGNVVFPTDICGANAIKMMYGTAVTTVYIQKDKAEIISNILDKNITKESKVLRILALESEKKNASLCDYIIRNDDETTAAEEIKGVIFS